jgi:hypothetical protein
MDTAPLPRGSGPEARPGHVDANPLLELTDQWMDCWRKAVALGYGLPAALTDPRQTRNAWLAELTNATDRYLRSPAFLEWMRSYLSAVSRSTGLISPNWFK